MSAWKRTSKTWFDFEITRSSSLRLQGWTVCVCFLFAVFGPFFAISSSCRLKILVRYRGPTPILDAAEAFGSQKQGTKQANAYTNEEQWPQDAVQYLYIVTLHTRSVLECLIRGFGIVIASVFIINLTICILKAGHVIIINPLNWITWLSTALQEKSKSARVFKVSVVNTSRKVDYLLDYMYKLKISLRWYPSEIPQFQKIFEDCLTNPKSICVGD